MLDPDGNIVRWNIGAQQSTGYSSGDVAGRHFSMFYPDNRVGGNIELTEAMRDRHFENEDWQLRKGGSRYWASIAITPLYNARGVHRGRSDERRVGTAWFSTCRYRW